MTAMGDYVIKHNKILCVCVEVCVCVCVCWVGSEGLKDYHNPLCGYGIYKPEFTFYNIC